MTDTQLALVIVGIIFTLNTSINVFFFISLRSEMNAKFDYLRNEIIARFDGVHQAILRVEGILDARLKHLEEK